MATGLRQVRDLVECSICTEEFRSPKMLPCQHTFCLPCLDTMTRPVRPAHNTTDSSANDNDVTSCSGCCPLCRAPFTVPDGGCDALPNNRWAAKLIDALEIERKNRDTAASPCNNNKRNRRARTCQGCGINKKYCRCSGIPLARQQQQLMQQQANGVIPTSTDGVQLQLNEVPGEVDVECCGIHPQRTLDYFCTEQQCRVPVCSLCLHQAHDGHKHRFIADAAVGSRSRIDKLTADARAKLATSAQLAQSISNARDLLNGSAADAVEQIRQHAELLHAEVDRVKEELIRAVEHQLSSLTTKYDECDRRLLTTMLDLRNVEQTCKQLRDNKKDVDVVRQTAVCEDEIDRLNRNLVELPNIATIRYCPEESQVQMTQFGAVHVVQHESDEDERQIDKLQQRESPTFRCPRKDFAVTFDPSCGVVVHGLVADPQVADTDVFQDMCSQYFNFRPTIISHLCRRLRWRWRRAPLLIVCENEADAKRIVHQSKNSTFRSTTGMSIVRYSLSK